MSAARETPMTEAEVRDWLAKNLPHWRLEDGWIRRTYKTSGWKGTLMVINTVGHLAEAAWHHPDITASYAWVEVRLVTHSAKGITGKDLELAKKIEDVVHWQPGKKKRWPRHSRVRCDRQRVTRREIGRASCRERV